MRISRRALLSGVASAAILSASRTDAAGILLLLGSSPGPPPPPPPSPANLSVNIENIAPAQRRYPPFIRWDRLGSLTNGAKLTVSGVTSFCEGMHDLGYVDDNYELIDPLPAGSTAYNFPLFAQGLGLLYLPSLAGVAMKITWTSGAAVTSLSGVGSIGSIVANLAGRSATFQFTGNPTGNTSITFNLSGTSGPPQNIRVFEAANESILTTQVTDPTWRTAMSAYNILRLMDFTNTNWSGAVNYADIATNSFNYWTGGFGALVSGAKMGPSVNAMAAVANETGRPIWINIPHQFTDAAVTSLAIALLAGITFTGSNVSLYVEYSNEVWNSGFHDTNAQLVCGKIPSPVATWNAISNGGFKISINQGAYVAITGMDFSAAADLSAVGVIIQAALTAAGVTLCTVAYNVGFTQFIFTAINGTVKIISPLIVPTDGSTDISVIMKGTLGTIQAGNGITLGQSGQYTYSIAQSLAFGSPINNDGNAWYGVRAAEVMSIFRNVFGTDSGNKWAGVVSTQIASTGVTTHHQTGINYAINNALLRAGDTANTLFSYLAVAPYIGPTPNNKASGTALTMFTWVQGAALTGFTGSGQQTFNTNMYNMLKPSAPVTTQWNTIAANRTGGDGNAGWKAQMTIATAQGWQTIMYEGGNGAEVAVNSNLYNDTSVDATTGIAYNTEFFKTLEAYASSAEAGQLHRDIYTLFVSDGGHLCNKYNAVGLHTKFGPWGAQEDFSDNSPCFLNIQTFNTTGT